MSRSFGRALVLLVIFICFGPNRAAAAPPIPWLAHPPIRVEASDRVVGYTPDQIKRAYGFDQMPGRGAGQKIAIIVAFGSPTIQADLDIFSMQFGLPKTKIEIVYPQGKPTEIESTWAIETALDVEWAHAIAPEAALLVVVSKSALLVDLAGAVDYAVRQDPDPASQVSMSWGGAEFYGQLNYDWHFNVQRTSFFASSGDSGAGILWPASSAYVIGVGGTTLKLSPDGTVLSETGWPGSGGGLSQNVPEPYYQRAWQSTGRRSVPDVSYSADPANGFPVFSSTSFAWDSGEVHRGWFQVGGTSAGAPQWAALMALVNSARSLPVAMPGPELYRLGSPQFFDGFFRDILAGCNGPGSCAGRGYDLVTGIGSPLAASLIPALLRAR